MVVPESALDTEADVFYSQCPHPGVPIRRAHFLVFFHWQFLVADGPLRFLVFLVRHAGRWRGRQLLRPGLFRNSPQFRESIPPDECERVCGTDWLPCRK